MKYLQNRALKTSRWLGNELVVNTDMMQNGYDRYRNASDLAAALSDRYSAGGTRSVILSGFEMVFTATRTFVLSGGMAVGYGGTYIDDTGLFNFVAGSGEPFLVMGPDDNVTFDAGDASDRYDIVEIRPVRSDYEGASRSFRDPITGVISVAPIDTKSEYTREVRVVKGTPGSSAPTSSVGWIKVAELLIPSGASVLSQDSVLQRLDWTTDLGSVVAPSAELSEEDDDSDPIFPAGLILSFGNTTAPSGFLACDGAAVSRTTYASLFTAIGTTWGVGDGSTTFNVPDLSGAFLRGTGTGTINARDKIGPAVGGFQEDQMQGHSHAVVYENSGTGGTSSSLVRGSSVTGTTTGSTFVLSPTTDGTNGTPRTGDETRPFNAGVLWCIKT